MVYFQDWRAEEEDVRGSLKVLNWEGVLGMLVGKMGAEGEGWTD